MPIALVFFFDFTKSSSRRYPRKSVEVIYLCSFLFLYVFISLYLLSEIAVPRREGKYPGNEDIYARWVLITYLYQCEEYFLDKKTRVLSWNFNSSHESNFVLLLNKRIQVEVNTLLVQ